MCVVIARHHSAWCEWCSAHSCGYFNSPVMCVNISLLLQQLATCTPPGTLATILSNRLCRHQPDNYIHVPCVSAPCALVPTLYMHDVSCSYETVVQLQAQLGFPVVPGNSCMRNRWARAPAGVVHKNTLAMLAPTPYSV